MSAASPRRPSNDAAAAGEAVTGEQHGFDRVRGGFAAGERGGRRSGDGTQSRRLGRGKAERVARGLRIEPRSARGSGRGPDPGAHRDAVPRRVERQRTFQARRDFATDRERRDELRFAACAQPAHHQCGGDDRRAGACAGRRGQRSCVLERAA